eukprot:CAMPEP_0196724626 /NCGR_PEP_ID=MMETSP1091-20130531/6397_1 /TAXON_ID=302021 /ORGANISM="Rhodomonas sp., Strain CCMP768" /LENGTH=125 /DNA_ID=CAMNT_0042066765 /DNA_START=153 /DNA_END=527 /DNA_ORIENTATION=+
MTEGWQSRVQSSSEGARGHGLVLGLEEKRDVGEESVDEALLDQACTEALDRVGGELLLGLYSSQAFSSLLRLRRPRLVVDGKALQQLAVGVRDVLERHEVPRDDLSPRDRNQVSDAAPKQPLRHD